jgi:predicted TIM-barrel fold metal-dependent hydrolase
MVFIDCHTHLFENFAGIINGEPIKSEEYGKVKIGSKSIQFLEPSFNPSSSTVGTLIAYMDWCGVEKAILMPNLVYGYHNEYSHSSEMKYLDKFKSIALVNVMDTKDAKDEISDLVENKGFIGLKIDFSNILKTPENIRNKDIAIESIMEYSNELGLFIFLHLIEVENIHFLKKMAGKYKKIRFIVCHFGSEATLDEESLENNNMEALLDIALENKNIWFDTSSINYHYRDLDHPFEKTCKLVEKVYSIIGPEKILWGSDYPGALTVATYKQLLNYIPRGCKQIPKEHVEMIMGLNSLDLFWKG